MMLGRSFVSRVKGTVIGSSFTVSERDHPPYLKHSESVLLMPRVSAKKHRSPNTAALYPDNPEYSNTQPPSSLGH